MGNGLIAEAGAAKPASHERRVARWPRARFYSRDHAADWSDFRTRPCVAVLPAEPGRDDERRWTRFDRGRATPTRPQLAGRAGGRIGADVAGRRRVVDQELLSITECRSRV